MSNAFVRHVYVSTRAHDVSCVSEQMCLCDVY
jgi:hypothetical protein